MMTFDSATSSFQALLVIKSYSENHKSAKFNMLQDFVVKKNVQNSFLSGVLSCNQSARLKVLLASERIKNLKTIANFNKILLIRDNNIFRTIS